MASHHRIGPESAEKKLRIWGSGVRISSGAPVKSDTYKNPPFEKIKLKRLFERLLPSEIPVTPASSVAQSCADPSEVFFSPGGASTVAGDRLSRQPRQRFDCARIRDVSFPRCISGAVRSGRPTDKQTQRQSGFPNRGQRQTSSSSTASCRPD